MKQVSTLYHNNTQEILGRVTLRSKNVFQRSSYVLVSDDEQQYSNDYKLIISSKNISTSTIPYCQVADLSIFDEGDVVSIDTQGKICFLYEIQSSSNVIFATARCNHRCIMCPQPPIAQEQDRTDFNLELIKLFDKRTKEVGITGGEPTLIGDRLFELIRQIQITCPKAAINILSNGVKFADIEYAAKLARCRHRDLQVDIPLFSDVAPEHNRIVRAKTFYKTVQGLYNLAKFRQRIGLRIVIHKQTYKRLPQLADYIYHNFPFVAQVAFMQMETIGLAEQNLQDLWIDPYDYNNELREAVLLLNDRGICTYIYNAQLCVLPEEIRSFAIQSISEWKDTYLPECHECCLKPKCAGFFSTNKKNFSAHIHKIESTDSL